MKMLIRSLALASSLLAPTIALAAPDATKPAPVAAAPLSDSDTAVVAHVHAVHLMEIDMGKTAAKQGSAAIQVYGKALVKDHTAADKDLQALAKKKGLAVIPADAPANDAEKAEMTAMMAEAARISTLKGKDFDVPYMKLMADGHTKELGKLDGAIGTVADADLKKYLEKIKPVIQRHADGAKGSSK